MRIEGIRYQPTEAVFFTDDFTRGEDNLGIWRKEGQWALSGVDSPQPNPNLSANPFALHAQLSAEHPMAHAVVGYWFWHGYAAQVSVKIQGQARAGLKAYLDDAGNCWALEIEPQGKWRYYPKGVIRLVRIKDGERKVADERPLPLERDQWYQLRLTYDGERIKGWLDDKLIVWSISDEFPMGRIGLIASGRGSVFFDDVIVAPPNQLAEVAKHIKITEQFTREHTMTEWATERGAFVEDKTNPGLWWHQGILFGDWEFDLALPSDDRLKGTFTLYFCPTQRSGESPIALRLTRRRKPSRTIVRLNTRLPIPLPIGVSIPVKSPGQNDFLITLLSGKRRVRRMKFSPRKAFGQILRVRRLGNRLSAKLGDKILFSINDKSVQAVRYLSFRSDGWEPDWSRSYLWCSHLLDDTFSIAPTRWRAGRGVWQVTARWPCSPGWAWFGGTGHRFPTLWSKTSFEGDTIIEAFVALKMKSRGNPYPNPRDMNVSFCADGWNLNSGYTFILAGWGNKGSALFRRGKKVAFNPEARFRHPTTGNFAGFHRHWFHIRIVKFGGYIACYVDKKLVVEWTDPEPLHGGHIAFWTVDNGLLLARVRVWYEKLNSYQPAPLPPSGLPDELPAEPQSVRGWMPIWNDESRAIITPLDEGDGVCVTNAMSGGRMLVSAPIANIKVDENSTLKMRMRIPLDVRINLYLKLNGKLCAIPLTGDLSHPSDIIAFRPEQDDVRLDENTRWVDIQLNLHRIGMMMGVP
ncbi:MAG TPA: hypothetical protein EYP10_04230, partial [Armatimonadetes bacterium]|nr:hypothetical protein [Armatimonadota bacterium]